MLVLAMGQAAYAYLLGPALQFLISGNPGAIAPAVGTSMMPASWDVAGRIAAMDRGQILAALPIVIMVVTLVKGVAYFGQYYLMGMVGQRVISDLRRALFDHILRLAPAFYAKRASGDLLQRFSADVQAVEGAVTSAVVSYLRDGLQVVVMLVTCFVIDWRMSLVAFGAIPVTLFPVVQLARRLKKVTGKAQRTGGELLSVVQEAVGGIRVVQAYGMEGWESGRYADANARLIRILRRGFVARGFSSPLMEVMAAMGLAGVIWWVGGMILTHQIEPGKFFQFVAAVLLLYTPVKQLGRQGQSIMQGQAAGERIFELLDTPSAVPDSGRRVLPPFSGEVRYEGVSFLYDQEKGAVLRGFDLTIAKGQVVALVGSSGGGKTTVANLLPRFWDVSGGRITLDGVDIREATLASLRSQIALVTQETLIFNDTVRANIAYGRPDIPLAEVERAARLAQAHEFIRALPEGYDTPVGERGNSLSGGQRQRLAIARAFLKDAPLLVLDEATSALDAESEREVQRALDSLMRGDGAHRRTTLVIAHRLSTIRGADVIAVISSGRVVESGRHDELVARGGEYARLYRVFEGTDRGAARVGHG
jgi:subfamily B ATP-binding cassette protein MsbA